MLTGPKGIGMLVEMAVEKGKSVKPNLKLGICGEHGGEPSLLSSVTELAYRMFHVHHLEYL